MDNPMLEAALRYAKVGWPVFQVQPRSKIPFAGSDGFKSATTNIGDITTWWGEFPDANVAIATGAPGPDVFDIDVKGEAQGYASAAKAAAQGLTQGSFAMAQTPSGGWHLYFKGTDQPKSSLGKLGLDFQAVGGYVLAPPSVLEHGVYTWLRRQWPPERTMDWAKIRDFFKPPAPRITPARESGDFEGLLAYMATYPEPGRNLHLFSIAKQFIDEGATESDFAALLDAALASGLKLSEAERTIRSARRGR